MSCAFLAVLLSAVVGRAQPPGRKQDPGAGEAQQQEPQEGDPQQDPQDLSHYERVLAKYAGHTVREIRVVDLRRFETVTGEPADSILRSITTVVGEPLDGRKLQRDLRRLWQERKLAARFFIQPVENDVRLYLAIEWKDEVFDELRFKGLGAFSQSEVEEILDIRAGEPISWLQAQTLRNILLARYRREGHLLSSIDVRPDQMIDEGDPLATPVEFRSLTMRVDEGPQVTVSEVRFRGNESYPGDVPITYVHPGDVLAADSGMKSLPGWFLVSGDPFSFEIIEEDLDRLRLFYRKRGFRDAQVDLADWKFVDASRDEVVLTFSVHEGPRYTVASVDLVRLDEALEPLPEGGALYPAEEVMEGLRIEPGVPYDAETIDADIRHLIDYYGQRGHPVSDNVPSSLRVLPVREVVDVESHEIHLTFRLVEGVPKRLRDVIIRGNEFTQDRVVRSKVQLQPGDLLDTTRMRRSRRILNSLRYFQDSLQGPRLSLEPVPGDEERVDLAVDVTEGETGQFRWGVGFGTGTGVQATLMFEKHNFDLTNLPSSPDPTVFIPELLDNRAFHGAGQRLNLLLAPGTEISQFAITWADPDIFRRHLDTIGLEVTGRRTLRRFDGYTTDRLAGGFTFSRQFTNETSVSLGFLQQSLEVEDPDPNAPTIVFDAEGQTELRSLELAIHHRDVDDPLQPSEGGSVRLFGEVAGGLLGAEEDYWKAGVVGKSYLPLYEDLRGRHHVFHLRGDFRVGGAYGDSDDLFLSERFYMGGHNLRGFDFRDAGPSQFGRPVGGEALFTASAEYQFPIVSTRAINRPGEEELLRGVVFSDYGMLGLGLDDDTFLEPRMSVGMGLRIHVPVFDVPIALDLGWPLLWEETDDREQLYFSISRR